MFGSSAADATLRPTIKFFCSYGGKIVPRQPDGRLRYHGGHTRVVAVHRSLPFSELLLKLGELCGATVSVRCQFPTEDLDALVSITCDEDLANLIEEYDRFASPQSPSSLKIRAFLFPPKPLKKYPPTTGTITSPSPHLLSSSSSKSLLSSTSSSSSSSRTLVAAGTAVTASCGWGCSPWHSMMPAVIEHRSVLDQRSLRRKMFPPIGREKLKGKSVTQPTHNPIPHPQCCYHGQHHGNTAHYHLIHNGNHWQ